MRVMQSFRAPRPTTNPYITMLDRSLRAELGEGHLRFDWVRALFGRYDVFHWHWPEGKLQGGSRVKTVGKHLLVAAIVLRQRLTGIAVVRTVHNVELPDVPMVTRWFLKAIDRTTDYQILINPVTRSGRDTPHSLILHGDYRDWYEGMPRSEVVPGRVGAFGGIRRYKSVDVLIDAYADAIEAGDEEMSLSIGGRPSSSELAADVQRRIDRLPRAQVELGFIEDEDFVRLITECEVVVLAYRFMHNSGSVLAALSLDRPVLVPRNEVNEDLAREVGEDWVLMYPGNLTGADLRAAVDRARARPADARPDLSARTWQASGRAHRAAYANALTTRRGVRAAASPESLGSAAS